jgi:hypothetical protein
MPNTSDLAATDSGENTQEKRSRGYSHPTAPYLRIAFS